MEYNLQKNVFMKNIISLHLNGIGNVLIVNLEPLIFSGKSTRYVDFLDSIDTYLSFKNLFCNGSLKCIDSAAFPLRFHSKTK
jgi:hypothetical protein